MDYIGKLVFIEYVGEEYRGESQYNGEFICINQTDNNLYCLKPNSGYEGHILRTFPLVGSKPYRVVSVSENDGFILQMADKMDEFASTPKESRSWASSVYDDNAHHARLIREAVGKKNSLELVEGFECMYPMYGIQSMPLLESPARVILNVEGTAEQVAKSIEELIHYLPAIINKPQP